MRRSPQFLRVLRVQKTAVELKKMCGQPMLVSYRTLARRSRNIKPTNGRISPRGTLRNLARHLITAQRRPR